MLKIAIVDDDPVQLAHAAAMAERETAAFDPAIETFSSPEDLAERIKESQYAPDIAVLDIELGSGNGVELAAELNRLLPISRVIFLTAYPEYASDVYKTEHIWFVLKNRAEEYLGEALRKAAGAGSAPQPGIMLTSRGSAMFLPENEILYLSREGRRAMIVTENGSFYSSRSPASLLGTELAPAFIRCHQGYWVNLEKITALERECFVLTNGERLPISRTCREEARGRFFAKYHLNDT